MNKYSTSLQIETYYNVDKTVVDNYKQLLGNVPVILKEKCYSFVIYKRMGAPKIVDDMTETEQALLETIYIGKCLTLEQIMIFMYLKGYKESKTKIRRTLDKMVFHQILQRIDILENLDDVTNKRKYYLVGEYTPCKKIGIPNVTMKKLFLLRKECGSKWPLYCTAMHIINHIALNQIIYNNTVKSFLIGEVRINRDYHLVMPLVLYSTNVATAFVFVTFMDAIRIGEIITKWEQYGKAHKKRIRLILITRDDVQQLIVRRCVEAMKSDLLMIGYTDYKDWFINLKNQVYVKTSVNAIKA